MVNTPQKSYLPCHRIVPVAFIDKMTIYVIQKRGDKKLERYIGNLDIGENNERGQGIDKVTPNVPLSPESNQALVKRPPKPHNNGKIVMEFDTDKCDKNQKQWVNSDGIVKQKDMLIPQVRTKADRLVKTAKEVKIPNGIKCYESINK